MIAAEDYLSEQLRELAAHHEQLGRARGRAEAWATGRAIGMGRAVLIVLDTRGIAVPTVVQERVRACTDLAQLETWLVRALTATTADEVIRG